MTQIDWSRAPEGTTHWDENPSRIGSFMKLERGKWFFWPVGETLETRWHAWNREGRNDLTGLVPRPITWNGEGLPPVGLEVEICDSDEPHEAYAKHIGEKVKIIAHDVLNGDDEGLPVAVYSYDCSWGKGYHALVAGKFRPIRTAEQIAAEEREKAIAAIQKASGGEGLPPITYTHAAKLYNAGARMPGEGLKA